MPKWNDDFIEFLKKGCQAWRQGDDQEGIEYFQQASLIWITVINQQTEEKSSKSTNYSAQKLIMKEVLDALENQDMILATDILEYDLIPIMRSDMEAIQ